MRSRRNIQLVFAAAMLVGVGGVSACAVFLDGAPALGEECEFDGDSGDCGQCVKDECQGELDACCGGSCGDALAQLDRCAGLVDHDACDALKSAEEGAASDLGDCVARKCDDACSSAEPITRCSGDGTPCFCEIDRDDPNDETCAPEGATCCADDTWPGSGSCACAQLGCEDDFDTCRCVSGEGRGNAVACDDVGYTYCCITTSGCECRDFPACEEVGEQYATDCWEGAAVCGSDQIEVDACHATEAD